MFLILILVKAMTNILMIIDKNISSMFGASRRFAFVPSKIWSELDQYKNNPFSLQLYTQRKFGARTTFKESAAKYIEYPAVAGEYDPYDDEIILEVQVSRDQFSRYAFPEGSWEKFKFAFMQTLMHEMVHYRQWKYERAIWDATVSHEAHANTVKNDNRQYMASRNEIQAYAHCAWLELKSNYKNFDMRKLESVKRKVRSDAIRRYMRAFNLTDMSHPVTQILIEEIRAWDQKYKLKLS